MNPIIKEISVKSVLSKTGIPGSDYCINPYVGCAHGCSYCYATFMKRYTGHTEKWGQFVDVKINAPDILQRQLKRAKKGSVIISSVTDAYQPVEARYKLTRKCLETLLRYQFPVSILTKSPLVLKDMDLFREFEDIEIGITITTDNEKIRKIFEPDAPPIVARINTLKRLYENGIKTYTFIGPLLPMNPDKLVENICYYSHSILIDRMNYVTKVKAIYNQNQLNQWLNSLFVSDIIKRLKEGFSDMEVNIC